MKNLERLPKVREAYAAHRARFMEENKQGLLAEVLPAIARQQVLPIETVIAYLKLNNRMVAEFLRGYRDEQGGLVVVDPREMEKVLFALKMCVDARSQVQTPPLLTLRLGIERTAGAGVRDGHVFQKLEPEGTGAVITHQDCGAERAAQGYYTEGLKFEGDIIRIVHAVTKATAQLQDRNLLSRQNAVTQRANACAAFYTTLGPGEWRDSPKIPDLFATTLVFEPTPHLVVIDPSCAIKDLQTDNPFIKELDASITYLHKEAADQGRTMASQYAHTVLFYDSSRVRDPRVLFGCLPNEGFSVTVNFAELIRKSATRTHARSGSVGSLKYAVSDHHQGHVKGVGKEDGNRFVLVVDYDPEMAKKVKGILVSNGNTDLNELTRNGETIRVAVYNPETHLITFGD